MISLIILASAVALRIAAKTNERLRARSLVTHIMDADVKEAKERVSDMVIRPTPVNELMDEVASEFAVLTFIPLLFYRLFAFSLIAVGPDVPGAVDLWRTRDRFRTMYDRDIYDLVDDWADSFKYDAVSAYFLFVAIMYALHTHLHFF